MTKQRLLNESAEPEAGSDESAESNSTGEGESYAARELKSRA